MNTKCVYYDLNLPDNQFARFINYLKAFNGFAKAAASMWFINSNKTCAEIRDEMIHLNLPSGQRIMVFNVGDTWSSIGLRPETSSWLHENWKP